MTKSTLPSPDLTSYSSVIWTESSSYAGVRYGLRRMSLGNRIELTKKVRELTLQNEFLQAGSTTDQLQALLGDLLGRRVYLEWGLSEIQGLAIDGVPATPESLIEKGPESLCNEIASAILASLHLSDEESKNS